MHIKDGLGTWWSKSFSTFSFDLSISMKVILIGMLYPILLQDIAKLFQHAIDFLSKLLLLFFMIFNGCNYIWLNNITSFSVNCCH